MFGVQIVVTALLVLIICHERADGAGSSLFAAGRTAKRHRTSSIMELRGGSSRKKKNGAKRKAVSEYSDIDEDEREEIVAKGYTPKRKSLILTLVTMLFRVVLAILSPLLPKGIAKRLNGKKSEVLVAGRTMAPSSSKSTTSKQTVRAEGTRSASGGGKKMNSMTQEHLEKSFTKGDSNNRVQKELRAFLANPPDNCKLMVGANIRVWVIQITGAEGTVFAGEKYKLKMVFPKEYPAKPPSVYFLKPTPRHVHVYSNGDICLNLLGKDWRPTMSAQLLVVSIYSMLSSAKEKRIPQDNAMHADAPPGQQQEGWLYHDDRC